jgi:hypothetical protein
MFIDEDAAEPITSSTSLSETEFNEPTLTREDLDGKLATVLAGHYSLDGFQ